MSAQDENVGARYSHFVADECGAEDGKVVVGWSHGPIPPGPDGISRDLKSVGPAPDGWALVGDSKAPAKFSFAPIGGSGCVNTPDLGVWSAPFLPGKPAAKPYGYYPERTARVLTPVNGYVYAIPWAVPAGATVIESLSIFLTPASMGRDWAGALAVYASKNYWPTQCISTEGFGADTLKEGGTHRTSKLNAAIPEGERIIWLAFTAYNPGVAPGNHLSKTTGRLGAAFGLGLPMVSTQELDPKETDSEAVSFGVVALSPEGGFFGNYPARDSASPIAYRAGQSPHLGVVFT